jgi:hypothetical protein
VAHYLPIAKAVICCFLLMLGDSSWTQSNAPQHSKRVHGVSGELMPAVAHLSGLGFRRKECILNPEPYSFCYQLLYPSISHACIQNLP